MRALLALLLLLVLASCGSEALTQFATKGAWSMSNAGCTNCFLSSCSAFDGAPTCSSRGLPTDTGSPSCCQSQTRWGGQATRRSGLVDMNSQASKSGLGFSGWAPNSANEASPLTAAGKQNVTDVSGTPFALGVVTHYNLPISAGTAATQGSFVLTLFGITVDGAAVGGELTWSFPLSIDETTNDGSAQQWGGRGCPYTTVDGASGNLIAGWRNDTTGEDRGSGTNGCTSSHCLCSDRIFFDSTVAASSTGAIVLGASRYRIDIVGFSDFFAYSASATASSFVSQEQGSTVKFLFGRLTLQCNCPGAQTSATNDICTCACPAAGSAATSQADCPNADYLFNSTACACYPSNTNCDLQRANLSPPLDTACESVNCALLNSVYTLSVVRAANASACQDAARADLCNFRCIWAASGDRANCQQRIVSCPTVTSPPCRRAQCVAGSCANPAIVGSGVCTPSTPPAACTNYACTPSGVCVGTAIGCPGAQQPNAAAGCACRCPNQDTANCNPSTEFLNTTTCQCQQNPCSQTLSGLSPAPDPACETVFCDAGGQLVFQPRTDGDFCSTSPSDKCAARCWTRTVGANPRSTCNNTAVVCPAPVPCTSQSCNAATGVCQPSPLASGSPCNGPQACFTYTCDGVSSCRGADPCPDAREPDSQAQCACRCSGAFQSQADCADDHIFNQTTCTCSPSGACTVQISKLSPPLDPLCETAQCTADSVLSITPADAASECGGLGAGGLCNRRCRRNGTRAFCETQPIRCEQTGGCTVLTCDDSDGLCKAQQRDEGADCAPLSGIQGCTSYRCDASGRCVGTPICDVGVDAADAVCRRYRCDSGTNQCVFDEVTAANCSTGDGCVASSTCVAGSCRTFTYDCQSQEAVDASLPGATTAVDLCAALICRLNASTGVAACGVDYFLDQGTTCADANCQVNSVCDGAGACRGERDPECDGNGGSRRAEIIGSAAAGGVLSVVGAGALILAAAGAAALVYSVRRRQLLNFNTWEAGAIGGATVSPLYVATGSEHVNPLSEL